MASLVRCTILLGILSIIYCYGKPVSDKAEDTKRDEEVKRSDDPSWEMDRDAKMDPAWSHIGLGKRNPDPTWGLVGLGKRAEDTDPNWGLVGLGKRNPDPTWGLVGLGKRSQDPPPIWGQVWLRKRSPTDPTWNLMGLGKRNPDPTWGLVGLGKRAWLPDPAWRLPRTQGLDEDEEVEVEKPKRSEIDPTWGMTHFG